MPHLDNAATMELVKKAQAGDRAAEAAALEGNRALVRRVLKRFLIPGGLAYEDLEQEGMIGLLEAVRTFDLSRTNTFATYAWWKVLSRVERAVGRHDIAVQEASTDKAVFVLHDPDSALRKQTLTGNVLDSLAARESPPGLAPEDVAVCLGLLTDTERQIVCLSYGLEGETLTSAEIAERLGLASKRSVDTVRWQGLRKIRAHLRETGALPGAA